MLLMSLVVVGLTLYTITLVGIMVWVADRVIGRFLADQVAQHKEDLIRVQDELKKELDYQISKARMSSNIPYSKHSAN